MPGRGGQGRSSAGLRVPMAAGSISCPREQPGSCGASPLLGAASPLLFLLCRGEQPCVRARSGAPGAAEGPSSSAGLSRVRGAEPSSEMDGALVLRSPEPFLRAAVSYAGAAGAELWHRSPV